MHINNLHVKVYIREIGSYTQKQDLLLLMLY